MIRTPSSTAQRHTRIDLLVRRLNAAGLALAVLLSACATSSDKAKPEDLGPMADLEKLYAEARDDLSGKAWDRAIKALEKIEARATGTLMGQQAMLDLAYAYWKSGERALAVVTLERFMRLHPSSPALDYALYLKGLTNFTDSLGLFSGISGQKVSERDQKAYKDAYQSFQQLIQQFPNSKYADDARVRMDFIGNALAEYEISVARYYMKRGAYLAAANRAQAALSQYEGAPALEDALGLMVQAYDKLGLEDLKASSLRVLRQNFPQSAYLGAAAEPASATPSAEPTQKPWWKVW